ncbi:MAG TPA: hypothetical protein VLV83_20655 [Acidobacteriota bacterium]|nr:hypothetical protein [Acidobacteriota bacterium]
MKPNDLVEFYDDYGSIGGGICLLIEAGLGLAQDEEYNFIGQYQGELTSEQLSKNLKLDTAILVFSVLRLALTIPLPAKRRDEATPFRVGIWGTQALSAARHGITVFAPAQSQAQVAKVLGAVGIAEGLARLILQIIVIGYKLDTSDIQDEHEKSMVTTTEILVLFGSILSFIGGACSGASKLTPEPESKALLKVLGGSGKALSGVLSGVKGAVTGLDFAVDFFAEA